MAASEPTPTHPAWGDQRDNKLTFRFDEANIFPQRNTTLQFSRFGHVQDVSLVRFPFHSTFAMGDYDLATQHGITMDAHTGAIKYTPGSNASKAVLPPHTFAVTVTTYQHLIGGARSDTLVGTHRASVQVEIKAGGSGGGGDAPEPADPDPEPADPVANQPATNADPNTRLYVGRLPVRAPPDGAQQVNLTAEQAATFGAAYEGPLVAHANDAYPSAKITAGQPARRSAAFGERVGDVRYTSGNLPGYMFVDYHTGMVSYDGVLDEERKADETKSYEVNYSAVYRDGQGRYYTVYGVAPLDMSKTSEPQPVAPAKPDGSTFTHKKAEAALAWYYYLLIALGGLLLLALAAWVVRRFRRKAGAA